MRRTGANDAQPAATREGTAHRTARRGRPRAAAVAAALLALPVALAASGCGGPADAATTRDITVMTFAPAGTGGADRPGMTALATAIGRQIDASGGLSRHKVKVLTCNEHDTSEGAAACVQEAVDAGVVAVVGSYSQHGDDIFPVLENKGIPYIGGYGLSTAEFRSPNSYPVNGGTPALLAGVARQLVREKCHSVAVVRPDTRAGDVVLSYLTRGLASAGIKPLDVPAPEQSTDYSNVARVAVGSDSPRHCVTAALAAEPTQAFLDGYRQQKHIHTRLSSVIGSFQQSVVDATGGSDGPLGGASASSWYPSGASKVWDPLRKTASTYAPSDSSIDASDPGVETTWVAYQVFIETAKRLGPGITSRKLIEALDTQAPVTTGGATPPLGWRLSDMLASLDTPRLVNTSVTFQVVKDGQFVDQDKGFTNVRAVLASAGS